MENSLSSVIIKVRNIDICRSFYRDMLNISDPVLDSNFLVEFRMDGNVPLIVEKHHYPENSFPDGPPLIHLTEPIATTLERLEQYGCEPEFIGEVDGFGIYKVHDPEANVLHITSKL